MGVCLIVRDEEEVISRCLGCVKEFADEIVVVDTGSSDKTVEAARAFTDKIFYFEWCDDFSAARNFAFEKAVSDYVMWLDADDVITAENRTRIRNLADEGGFDMAYLLYAAAFDGDSPAFVYNRERIFKRSQNFRFSGAVHEAVSPRGKIVYSEARIDHKKVKISNPFRNLNIYRNMIARGISLDERAKFYYGRELMYNKMYREGAAVLKDFLNGGGWTENKAEACLNIYFCHAALGEEEEGMLWLLKAFLYTPPRPQTCCILGERFLKNGDLQTAVFWYKQALQGGGDAQNAGGFVNVDFNEFIPCMQLCVLYDRLGDYKTACAYNERAGKVKPASPEYLYNRRYFKNKLSDEVKND